MTRRTAIRAVVLSAVLAGGLVLWQGSVQAGTTCFGLQPTIFAVAGEPTIGTSGSDVIAGTSGADVIYGKGGDDRICSKRGADRVYAGYGDDRVNLGSGNDFAKGGPGDDLIRGKSGHDDIHGNGGEDTLIGGSWADSLHGGKSADDLSGNSGPDAIWGNSGADDIDGGTGTDECRGGTGPDTGTRCEITSSLVLPPTPTPTPTPTIRPTPVPSPTPACHPSYTPCLMMGSDYDCVGRGGDGPNYTGRVLVHGPDEYDLDRDGDGIGCDNNSAPTPTPTSTATSVPTSTAIPTPTPGGADTSAPVLVSFDFSPTAVDVSSSSRTVVVTMQITDETGVNTPNLSFSSRDTAQSSGFGVTSLISGTIQNGTWQSVVTIDQGSAPGIWDATLFPLSDTLGNSGSFGPPPGFPDELTVTSSGGADTSAPVLVSFDFSPTAVDVSSSSRTVVVTMQITDETGVNTPNLSFSSRDTAQSSGFGVTSLISGTIQNGTWQSVVTIDQGSAPGIWDATLFPLSDTLGNSGSFGPPPGFPDELTVTSSGGADTSAPVLVSFDFSPTAVDVSSSSRTVVVTMQITDETGVNTPNLSFSSRDTAQSSGFGVTSLISGTIQNGTWQSVVTIDQGSAPGIWDATLFPLSDTLGNSGSFGPPPGFPDELTVN